jgi:hypothetical protein
MKRCPQNQLVSLKEKSYDNEVYAYLISISSVNNVLY